MLGQYVNELPFALVAPLAAKHAGDLAQFADAAAGGVGGGELGGGRRDGLRGAHDDVSSGGANLAEGDAALRVAYCVRIKGQ